MRCLAHIKEYTFEVFMCFLPGGDTRSTSLAHIKEYTFEVFMCAAILMERRQDLAKCNDSCMIFTFINKSVTLFFFFLCT